MSWAVIRRRLPALRTLPSRIVATSRSLPISRTCRSFPLCAKEDVLAATRSPSSRVNALINSSAMPSPKYSWSPSGLMSVKGSTAMEGGACSSPFGPLASAATGCSSGSMGANGSRDTKSSSDLEDPRSGHGLRRRSRPHHPAWGDIERPSEHEGHREAEQDERHDQRDGPGRQVERGQEDVGGFAHSEPDDQVGHGYLHDVAPLQLGPEGRLRAHGRRSATSISGRSSRRRIALKRS